MKTENNTKRMYLIISSFLLMVIAFCAYRDSTYQGFLAKTEAFGIGVLVVGFFIAFIYSICSAQDESNKELVIKKSN